MVLSRISYHEHLGIVAVAQVFFSTVCLIGLQDFMNVNELQSTSLSFNCNDNNNTVSMFIQRGRSMAIIKGTAR